MNRRMADESHGDGRSAPSVDPVSPRIVRVSLYGATADAAAPMASCLAGVNWLDPPAYGLMRWAISVGALSEALAFVWDRPAKFTHWGAVGWALLSVEPN